MASASTSVAIHPVGVTTFSVKPEVFALSYPGSLGIASPSAAQLRASFTPSRRTLKSSQPSFHVICKTLPDVVLDKVEEGEDVVAVAEELSPLTPSTIQVQSLIENLCDETRIAELKLKVGYFSLHVKRDVGKSRAPANSAAAPSTPIVVAPAVAPVVVAVTPAPNQTTNSLVSSLLPATVSKTASLFGLLEAAADQGLSFVTSPKVGVFRRGKNVRGQIGKPLVEEGAVIKEGQVVGYLEQLGTQQPVESQVSGEVVQVLWEDGESVGYGDPLISIRPSFPGIGSKPVLN